MHAREASPDELEAIYLMGYDAWGDGQPVEEYLHGCAASPKYKRGNWFVLESDGALVASLIRYAFSPDTCGIGSIATPPTQRRHGHASRLIEEVLKLSAAEGFARTYLYSDIDARFYERFGFRAHARQRHPGSTCMIRGEAAGDPPPYF